MMLMDDDNELRLAYEELATRIGVNIGFLVKMIDDDVRKNLTETPDQVPDKSPGGIELFKKNKVLATLQVYRMISENTTELINQVIIVRRDILNDHNLGQIGIYIANASCLPLVKCNSHLTTKWYDDGMPKVVFGCKDESVILKFEEYCINSNIPHHVVVTGGDNMVTAIGIGPWFKSQLDGVTSKLTLLQ